jgi:hypothetical protein
MRLRAACANGGTRPAVRAGSRTRHSEVAASGRSGPEGSLAAEFGLVPLSLGGVLSHQRLVEPLLDIAAEAVRGKVGEVEGLYRHRCQDARPLRWISAISAPSA